MYLCENIFNVLLFLVISQIMLGYLFPTLQKVRAPSLYDCTCLKVHATLIKLGNLIIATMQFAVTMKIL